MPLSAPRMIPLCFAAVFATACASDNHTDRRPMSGQRGDISGSIARPLGLLIASMDKDGDHRIALSEYRIGIDTEWLAIGFGNTDVGALELTNWAGVALGASDALPNRLSFDTDLNGRVTKDEFDIGMIREFKRLDENNDDVVTHAELLSRLPDRRVDDRSVGPGGGGMRPPGGGDGQPPDRGH